MSHPEPPSFEKPLNPERATPVAPELVALVVEVAGAPPGWARRVTPDARLDADLLLDETELSALAGRLRERFGASADLAALRAGLDLPGLEALTVADLHRLLPEEDAR
ncbi:hypothetical protein GCM10018790_58000 [Kitasatospora xanthocidica]|uniref:hypothetical protein n=1 Tax=Kitasatospora xanthocidica TaxID=83382 RepID=UPI001679FE0E|nr:hypothetical protein [Kitasatospora xanthocidica]GHF72534.1 hypothetical protein GCM10018790_58000 [Kitasatospora xanthocidica]